MLTPKITVVTTFYNRANYLVQCIESVLGQSETDFQYILWDDGSTDFSLSLALSYSDKDSRITVVKAPHQGIPHGLIGAMQLAKGKYIGWVDSDDWVAPNCLEKTSAVLDETSNIGLIYTDYWDVDDEGKTLGLGYRCGIPYFKDALLVTFMSFHFRLFRKSVWDALVEPIDLSLQAAIDYDFCLKASEVTNFYHLEEPLYYYRLHFQALSNLATMQQAEFATSAKKKALIRRGYL